MQFKLLDNIAEIRDAFLNRFVMSWEEFQIKQKEWIAEMAKTNYPINIEWYEQSYMWDRMNPGFPRVSMEEALAFLKNTVALFFLCPKKARTLITKVKSSSILLPKQMLILWR